MANTYELIASSTVGSGGVSSVTFSSIPNTYTDLKLSLSTAYNSTGAQVIDILINSSSSNFSGKYLQGNGSGTASGSASFYVGLANPTDYTANVFSSTDIYIPNYTSTSYAKSYSAESVTENNGTTSYAWLIAGLWNPATQAAISSIQLKPDTGSFIQYSTFYLYGIKNS